MEHPYTELAPVYSSFCQTLIKYSHSLQNSYLLSQTSRRVLLAAGFRLNQIVSWFLSAMILYFPRSLKSLPRKLRQQRRTIHRAKIDRRKKPFLLNSSCCVQSHQWKLSWTRDVTVSHTANMLINEENMSLEAISLVCSGVEIRFSITINFCTGTIEICYVSWERHKAVLSPEDRENQHWSVNIPDDELDPKCLPYAQYQPNYFTNSLRGLG